MCTFELVVALGETLHDEEIVNGRSMEYTLDGTAANTDIKTSIFTNKKPSPTSRTPQYRYL